MSSENSWTSDTTEQAKSPRHPFRTGLRMIRVGWFVRRWAVIGYGIGSIVEIGCSILSIYATAKLGSLLAKYFIGQSTENIWFWLSVDIASAIGIALGNWTIAASRRMLYFKIVIWATTEYQQALSRLDIAEFDNTKTRNQINKVSAGYTWQMSNLLDGVLDFCYSVVRLITIIAVAAQIGWWVILILALFLVPSLIGESKLQKLQWFVFDTRGDNRHVFWGLDWLVRQSRSQMELRSLQAKNYVLEKVSRMNRVFYHEQEKIYLKLFRFIIPTKVLEVGGTAVGSVVLLRQFLAGQIGLDRYFFLAGALLRVGGALNAMFGTVARIQEQLLYAEDYFALVDKKPKIVDRPTAKSLTTSTAPRITFDHVSFCYPGKKYTVFDNVSFSIAPGEHLAIVGENGAGKSTLIKLLLRFYRPTSGRITIDGIDLQDVALESWYARLATLFQDFNQYPFPIHENISVGRSDVAADRARVIAAADESNASDMVKHYQHGWETVLDSSFKKGVEPSGGQWQRVALARAFYRDAPVLILDEPTSAIDAKAEYDIFNNIFAHYQDRTAIIVSHRFSTVRRAHRIIVLDEGKIREQGTHAELMKQKGLYHELFTKQAEGYKE